VAVVIGRAVDLLAGRPEAHLAGTGTRAAAADRGPDRRYRRGHRQSGDGQYEQERTVLTDVDRRHLLRSGPDPRGPGQRGEGRGGRYRSTTEALTERRKYSRIADIRWILGHHVRKRTGGGVTSMVITITKVEQIEATRAHTDGLGKTSEGA
jgi:hypothetical protein